MIIHDNPDFFNKASQNDPLPRVSSQFLSKPQADASPQRHKPMVGAAPVPRKEPPMFAQFLSFLLFETPLSVVLLAVEARGYWLVYEDGRLSLERMPADL